jgi:hypothetical protein
VGRIILKGLEILSRAGSDQHEISARGGGGIECYPSESGCISRSNGTRYCDCERQTRLTVEVRESAFELDDCFELLSRQEIERIWETLENKV